MASGNIKQDPQFGQRMLQHFDFDPNYRNLNQGSFGSSPRAVRKIQREYQDEAEASPDVFIRYTLPVILDESRQAMAKFLDVPTDTVVFVPNATTGINTVLRNMVWNDDCRDEILYFSTLYGSCGKITDYVVDSGLGRVSSREVGFEYPCEDEEILEALRTALKNCARADKRPKICIFDTVSSSPGVRFPFEEMTRLCREAGILSLVDGAQGVGMIDLYLSTLDPDFFVSNCHKWLHVPRGCAVLYVPFRNQGMIRSTLPTSHGYVSASGERFNPLPTSSKSAFVNNFEFVGTLDSSPYLCVKHAILWREAIGGEEQIIKYNRMLAKEGGKKIASILGTKVLNNNSGTMSECAMTNVALPLQEVDGDLIAVSRWMLQKMMDDYKTFLPLRRQKDGLWVRVSAQIYLEIGDFEWAGNMLLELCDRVKKGEHRAYRLVDTR